MKDDKLETISNLFEGNEIRSIWDSEKEDYYFSVVDVIAALTNSSNPRKYWSVLKLRLKNEGSEVTTNCSQLQMLAPDGKLRLRDAMKTSEYKAYKGLRKESLRDNMTDIEIALSDLGEVVARELAKEHKTYGLEQNKKIAKMGGHAAKVARDDIEMNLSKSVIISDNKLTYQYVDDKKQINKKRPNDINHLTFLITTYIIKLFDKRECFYYGKRRSL